MEREWTESGLRKSMNWRFIEVICFLFIWDHITVRSSRPDPSATEQHVTKQYDWLISDRGPFHHSRSYLSFVERFRQGFTTRYKIYRWVHLFFFFFFSPKPPVLTCRHQLSKSLSTLMAFFFSVFCFFLRGLSCKKLHCALFIFSLFFMHFIFCLFFIWQQPLSAPQNFFSCFSRALPALLLQERKVLLLWNKADSSLECVSVRLSVEIKSDICHFYSILVAASVRG